MDASPTAGQFPEERSELLRALRQVQHQINAKDYETALISARVLQKDPRLASHPDISAEALGNLGTLLIFSAEADEDKASASHALDDAIELLNRARSQRRNQGHSTTIFDANLALAHYHKFRATGRTGELLVAKLILDGTKSHVEPDLADWVNSIRKCLDEATRPH